MMRKTIILRTAAVLLMFLFPPICLCQTSAQVQGLVPKIKQALKKGDREGATWYMARHIGLSLKLHYKMSIIPLMKLQSKLNLTNFGLFSANLAPGMIDWFITRPLYNWGAAPSDADDVRRKAVIRADSNREYSVRISARPLAQEWSIIGSRAPVEKDLLLVCDNRAPPELTLTVRSNGLLLGPVVFGTTNEYVHSVLPVDFRDLDSDSRPEIAIRYNVCRKDGFYQRLDLYRCAGDPPSRLELWKSFTGGPSGAVTFVSNSMIMTARAVPGRAGESWLVWSKSRVDYFKPSGGDFKLHRTEERTNILMTQEYMFFYQP